MVSVLAGCAGAALSPWSEWSACSRTCGGGASYQRRTCTASDCTGSEDLRFKTCNWANCPLDSPDFRSEQCKAYNNIRFRQELHTWRSSPTHSEPCSLHCEAEGRGFIVRLAPRVLDGTPCGGPRSKDMCIEGVCRSVGCDDLLESSARLDQCGVCGGNGTSCVRNPKKVKVEWKATGFGACSVTCGVGQQYTTFTCHDVISGVIEADELCAGIPSPEKNVKDCQPSRCRPRWIVGDWGRCSKTCGGGIMRRHTYCVEELQQGAFERLAASNCTTAPPRSEKPCHDHPCPLWTVGQWSKCTTSCGDGIQTRDVVCTAGRGACRDDDRPVSQMPCQFQSPCLIPGVLVSDLVKKSTDDTTHRKPTSWRGGAKSPPDGNSGNSLHEDLADGQEIEDNGATESSPYYHVGAWGPCSVTCGRGVRSRLVRCTDPVTRERVTEAKCTGTHPTEVSKCNRGHCPQSDAPERHLYMWQIIGYSACSATCIGGRQEAQIACVSLGLPAPEVEDDALCRHITKPVTFTQPCNVRACPPSWEIGSWSECSATCGGGQQHRQVNCIETVNPQLAPSTVAHELCGGTVPLSEQACNTQACEAVWNPSTWSKCSVTCGTGQRTRGVGCRLEISLGVFEDVPVSSCPAPKPTVTDTCHMPSCIQSSSWTRPPPDVVQLRSIKTLSLRTGGKVTLLPRVNLVIYCSVYDDGDLVAWQRNGREIPLKKRYNITADGSLRIKRAAPKDAGVYTCTSTSRSSNITLAFQTRSQARHKRHQRILVSPFRRDNHRAPSSLDDDDCSTSWKDSSSSRCRRHLDSNVEGESNATRFGYVYMTGPWSSCSNHCSDNGLQHRRVTCEIVGRDLTEIYPLERCMQVLGQRPSNSRPCGITECGEWETSDWSECSSEHCSRNWVGLRRRRVICLFGDARHQVNDTLCDPRKKPEAERECRNPSCIATWTTGNWTRCSRSCGGTGFTTRLLRCGWQQTDLPAGAQCEGLQRPHVFKACPTPSCSEIVCRDSSRLCDLTAKLGLCDLDSYARNCCYSCARLANNG